LGLFHRIQLDCGFPLVAYVTSHSLETLSLREGKEVNASFKATAIHVVRRTDKGPGGQRSMINKQREESGDL